MEKGRPPLFIIFCALFLFIRIESAFSQCSDGSYLGNDCNGVSFAGCCGVYGDLKWCEYGALCWLNCKLNPICGWSPAQGIYNCGTEGYADPTGANPYFCKIPCGTITHIGCCETNSQLRFCNNGTLEIFDCSKNPTAEKFCGWDVAKNFYNCVALPKPGPQQHPYQCGVSCTPNCTGKVCGPDGCNGVCGFCKGNEKCNDKGQCEPLGCVPDCLGKECGPDGCGSSCGICQGNEVCSEDFKCIVEPCKPDCYNKECGSDLCGGVCGVCQPPKVCSKFFKCVLPEDENYDAFSGDIAEDSEGEIVEVAEAKDTDTTSIIVCPEGMVYYYGKCVKPSEPHEGQDEIKQGQGSKCGMSVYSGDLKSFAIFFILLMILRRSLA